MKPWRAADQGRLELSYLLCACLRLANPDLHSCCKQVNRTMSSCVTGAGRLCMPHVEHHAEVLQLLGWVGCGTGRGTPAVHDGIVSRILLSCPCVL